MANNTKLSKLEQQPLTSDEEEEEEDDSSQSSSSSSSSGEEEDETTSPSKTSAAAPVTATPTKRKRAVKGEKKKRKRRKKDPEAPKRPKTGYLRFCDHHRAEIQKKLNTTYVKEVSVVLGQMWKDLDPVEKARYNDEFKNDNERYHEQMKQYRVDHPLPDFESSSDDSDVEDGKKKKKKKDPNAPKTPLTGYMQFAKEHRNEIVSNNPEMKHTMVNKELGKMWKNLTEAEREVYNLKYRDAKKQHEVAMRQYKEEHPSSSSSSDEDESSKKKSKKSKKETGVGKKKKDPNAPKAPPNSYNLYSASVRDSVKEKNPTLNHKQINQIVGQMWQDLPKEEKETFINQANGMRAEYLQKVKVYTGGKGKEVATPSKSSKKASSSSSNASSGQTPTKGRKQNVIASSDEESDDESADEQSQDEQSGSEDESESSDSD